MTKKTWNQEYDERKSKEAEIFVKAFFVIFPILIIIQLVLFG